jgi:hypothetical protein
MYCVFRAHQTRRSGREYSRPISAEVALFLFASHSFLANYLRFMVNLIDKAIVINVKIDKNERKGFYSSNKEGLICLFHIFFYICIWSVFATILLISFIFNNKFMFCICFIIIIDLIFVDFRFYSFLPWNLKITIINLLWNVLMGNIRRHLVHISTS